MTDRPASSPPVGPPLAFVDDLDDPVLDAADHHHLSRVRRVRVGELVSVSDGAGRWRPARLGHDAVLEAAGEVRVAPSAAPAITVAFALVKGERPELITQKLTELGVDRILPFVAERSVTRWDAPRAQRHVERLRKVAREACMQSRRCLLPEVGELADLASVAALPGACAADFGGPPLQLDRPVLLVGPEGGWSDGERRHLPPPVGLGELVLRTDTAAITGAGILAALRRGDVLPTPAQR